MDDDKRIEFPNNRNLSGMYEDWFLEYASYVILERAIPKAEDGLKPVQRRILHAMKQMHDSRYHKVANIIGNTMQYHPHGDQAIGDALVNLGQKNLLIDTQGNWGDIQTGDRAAAARYIEARLSPFALEVSFNANITKTQLSYDGRTILMSERLYDSGGVTNRGRIVAYTYANGEWSTKGNQFLGSYAEESFGRAVDMSEDGNYIIISTKPAGGTNQPPRVEVHRWNGTTWVQKGQSLGYEVGWSDEYGPSCSISNDGNTIAIGAQLADVAEGSTATNAGSVDVYHWDASTSKWGPNGSASSWPENSDTSAAAIQARLTTGHKLTKIFDKDSLRFGCSVSLSGDGKRLIVS